MKAPSYEDFQLLSPCCGFPEIFQEMSVDPYGHKAPRCELVYSRSDYGTACLLRCFWKHPPV